MGNSFKVLIVSENSETQEGLKKNLTRLGCKVKIEITAESGIE